jgi:hypothetical protein
MKRIRVSAWRRSVSGSEVPVRRIAGRFFQASRPGADSEGRGRVPVMVRPKKPVPLGFLGRSAWSGLVLSDLLTFAPISHLRSLSFSATFVAHIGDQIQ